MDSNTKVVMTPRQVADALGVTLRLVYRQIKAGVIPSVKVGDKYLIPVSAFNKWLERNQGKTLTDTPVCSSAQ